MSGGSTLTFTTANWNTPQSVTLSAAEDADVANGTATFSVSSTGLPTVNVAATEADNDTLGLVVSTTALTVNEGGIAIFTVKLSDQPGSSVSVTTSRSSGDTDLSVNGGATLNFTTANWSTPQSVTLSATEDADVANGQAVFTVASAGLVSQTVTATEADNDTLGLVVTPTAVTVAEGGAANFTVKLSAQPSASVSVTTSRSSGDANLGVSGGATLAFTTANWNTPQTVTLSAVEDADAANGTATFAVTSAGLTTVNVTATEADNDTLALVVTPMAVTVSEGQTASFSIRLGAQPAGNVSVATTRAIGDTDLSVSGGATLTFTTANWNTPQNVTLSAAEDADAANGTATFAVSSAGLPTVNVAATEADNDTLGLVVSTTALPVNEGGTASFTVKLSAQPGASVSVTTSRSSGDADLSVSGGATLTFTTANWSTPQNVTLSAAEDADVANGQAVFTVASAGLVSQTVTATEADNDTLGLLVTPTAVIVAEGGAANFTVKLSAQPSASVSVTTSRSSGDSDLSLSGGATLTFTTANWNTPQNVTLSAAEDADAANGAATFAVTSAGLTTINVAATEADNDTLNLVVTPTAVTVNEGQTASFSVRLGAQPAGNVSVATTRASGDSDLSVSGGATLTFTAANWNTPQSATLSAAEDADAFETEPPPFR